MSSQFSINTRAVLIFALTSLALGWIFFFLWQFPWIVPADSNLGTVEKPIAYAGGMLFVIAFSIWLPAGLVGKSYWSLLLTALMLSLTTYFGLSLYPTTELWHYPFRFAMHLLQFGILVCWALNCWANRERSG